MFVYELLKEYEHRDNTQFYWDREKELSFVVLVYSEKEYIANN